MRGTSWTTGLIYWLAQGADSGLAERSAAGPLDHRRRNQPAFAGLDPGWATPKGPVPDRQNDGRRPTRNRCRQTATSAAFRHIDPDNRPDWFLAISPHKKVPVLRIDEKVSLFESNAIAEYLDETTEPRLHPNDPVLRAINRAWTDYVPTFANLVTAGAYADDEASYKASAENIPMAFERLELALAKQTAGP